MYLSLRGIIYANNSVLFFSRIGEAITAAKYYSTNHFGVDLYRFNQLSSPTSLQCNTDKIPCCRDPVHGQGSRIYYGNWFFPNGSSVLRFDTNHTMYRTRWSDGTVSLNRRNDTGSYATGLFCCVVPDAADIEQTLCANVGK